jgi:hypothetical protein
MPIKVSPPLAEVLANKVARDLMERLVGSTPMLSWQAVPADSDIPCCRNGSAFLIGTGAIILGVTAGHVVQGYVGAKRVSREIQATLGGMRFDLEQRVISCGQATDIATFRVYERDLADIRFNVLQEAWPPIAPADGDLVVFAGWPGHERVVSPELVRGGAWIGIGKAQVSASRITIVIDHSEGLLSPIPGVPTPPPNLEVGGISGGPVMRIGVREARIGWRLGGVLIEGAAGLDVVFAQHADVIQSDGTIQE